MTRTIRFLSRGGFGKTELQALYSRRAAATGIPSHMLASVRPTMTASEVRERARVAVKILHEGKVKLLELSQGVYDKMRTTLAEAERSARLRRIRQNRPRRRLSGGRRVSRNSRNAVIRSAHAGHSIRLP